MPAVITPTQSLDMPAFLIAPLGTEPCHTGEFATLLVVVILLEQVVQESPGIDHVAGIADNALRKQIRGVVVLPLSRVLAGMLEGLLQPPPLNR